MTVPLVPEIRVHSMGGIKCRHRVPTMTTKGMESKCYSDNEEKLEQEVTTSSNQEAYRWSVDEVLHWCLSHHFSPSLVSRLKELEVDGDLLLRLEDEEIRRDLRDFSTGIERKRFMRELDRLKSALDLDTLYPHCHQLLALLDSLHLRRYAYSLLTQGVFSLDQLRSGDRVESEALLKECGISAALHRLKIVKALHYNRTTLMTTTTMSSVSLSTSSCSLESELSWMSSTSLCDSNQVVVVAFPRGEGNGSAELASLLLMALRLRGMAVLSAEEASDFLLQDTSITLVLALTDGNFLSQPESVDPVLFKHLKLVLSSPNANVISVLVSDPLTLHPVARELRALSETSVVRWEHDYQRACVDKLIRVIKGVEGKRPAFSLRRARNSSHNLQCKRYRPVSGDSALGISPP